MALGQTLFNTFLCYIHSGDFGKICMGTEIKKGNYYGCNLPLIGIPTTTG